MPLNTLPYLLDSITLHITISAKFYYGTLPFLLHPSRNITQSVTLDSTT